MQKKDDSVVSEFHIFFESIRKKNFEESVNYFPDNFVEVISKEEIVEMFEQMFNDPKMSFKISRPTVNPIRGVDKVESKYYQALNTSYYLECSLINQELTEMEIKFANKVIRLSLKNVYGTDDFEYDEKRKLIRVGLHHRTYAISENGLTDWKFLMEIPNQTNLYSEFIPLSVLRE